MAVPHARTPLSVVVFHGECPDPTQTRRAHRTRARPKCTHPYRKPLPHAPSILTNTDAENCPLPQGWTRGGAPFVHPETRQPLGHIDGAAVVAEVLWRALATAQRARNGMASSEEALRAMVKSVNVTYHFVLNRKPSFIFSPSEQTVKGLRSCSVDVIDPGSKKNDVDVKIKELMTRTITNLVQSTVEARESTIFVLISGDDDFSHEVRNAVRAGIDVVVLYNEDAPASAGFLANLRSKAWAAGCWREIDFAARAEGYLNRLR